MIAQFALEVDPKNAAQDINEKIASVLARSAAGHPARGAARRPGRRAGARAVGQGSAGRADRELTRFADKQVKQRIERLKDVGQVVVLGGQDRQINVELDPIRIAAAGVSALEVQRAIASSNVNAPSGRIETGPTNTSLRIEGRAINADDIGKIVVRRTGEHPIRVDDVATVIDSEEDADTSASRNGVPAIALSVRKQSGTNTVAVVDLVQAAVKDLQAKMPAGLLGRHRARQLRQIRTSASQVLEHLVVGALLAALVVLLFLGSLRSTVIAAVAIPVSIISTFGLMMIAGLTLNLMTLLALALAVGIVIDDAIVVLENIYRFIDEKKMKPFPAAIHATKEIGLAVLATTLSLMAVFLPVAFMSGIVGRFLYSFGITMAFAIGVSMIVAFTLTPMMAARMPRRSAGRGAPALVARAGQRLCVPADRARLLGRARVLPPPPLDRAGRDRRLVHDDEADGQEGRRRLPAPNDEAQFEVYIQAAEGTTLESTTLIGERLARRSGSTPRWRARSSRWPTAISGRRTSAGSMSG